MRDGDELVEAPFQRLIEADQLMAFRHEGFWRPMDTLKDKQIFEDLVERHDALAPQLELPDRLEQCRKEDWMKLVGLAGSGDRLSVLCIGAHPDDIEIGATILGWIDRGVRLEVHWAVLSAYGSRTDEARASAEAFLNFSRCRGVGHRAGGVQGQLLPVSGSRHQDLVRGAETTHIADVILCRSRNDAHQDPRAVSMLTWNTFCDHAILEYEIPKWDGDLGQPNVFISASRTLMEHKAKLLHNHFGTQCSKNWFDA